MATRDLSTNDPMLDPITGEVVVIAPGHSFKSVTEKVSRIVLTAHTPVGWFFGFLVAGGIVMLLLTCLTNENNGSHVNTYIIIEVHLQHEIAAGS